MLVSLDSCVGSEDGLNWYLGGKSRGFVEWLEIGQRQKGERFGIGNDLHVVAIVIWGREGYA